MVQMDRFQGRNRDADVKKKPVDTLGGGGGGTNGGQHCSV